MKTVILKPLFLATFAVFYHAGYSQILTKEDSLSAGLTGRKSNYSALSGYGEAKVNYDLRQKTGTANLTRNVLFFGHKFSDKVYFFSEMEMENAKVSADSKGEISMEQLFLKFNINQSNYISAGLIIPRIGLINENHLPTTFNGNDRPTVERLVIPSTWREIGVAYYGSSRRMSGLNYSLAVMNGLNSKNFDFGTGIREGRSEGSKANASNLAVTGALLYYFGNFRLQFSSYYGGSAGIDNAMADSLKLKNGIFGTPVCLSEANVRYSDHIAEFKALWARVDIPDARAINAAYENQTPNTIQGMYFEAGLHLLQLFHLKTEKNLTLFSRLESLDLNRKIPENTKKDPYQKQLISVTGLVFSPAKGVVIKTDYVLRKTGDYNTEMHDGSPGNVPFYNSRGYFNLGLGYSF